MSLVFEKGLIHHRPPTNGTVIRAEDIIPDVSLIQLYKPVPLIASITAVELLTLVSLVKKHRPMKLFEFGTCEGRTTINLALNSPAGSRVHTFDLPIGKRDSKYEEFYDDLGRGRLIGEFIKMSHDSFSDKIVCLHGDSMAHDFSAFYGREDFIFVDGCHDRPLVDKDSENALKMANGTGLVVWHDYGEMAGVTEYLNQLGGRLPLVYIDGTSLVYHEAK